MMTINPYKILKLKNNCTDDAIRAAYRLVAKRYHPDNLATGNAEKFKKAKLAHDTLLDPIKRHTYDQFGFIEGDERSQKTFLALQNLRQLLTMLLQQISADKMHKTDIIASMYHNIEKRAEELRKQIEDTKQQVLLQNSILANMELRVVNNSKKLPNFFVDVVKESLASLPGRITQAEKEFELLAEMKKVLKNYQYNFEQELQQITSGMTIFTITI